MFSWFRVGVQGSGSKARRLWELVGLCSVQTSKPISAEQGLKLGLVDALAPPASLLEAAKKWALDIAAGRRPWLQSLQRTDKLDSLSEARAILKFARVQAEQTAPNLTHPLRCLDADRDLGSLMADTRGTSRYALTC